MKPVPPVMQMTASLRGAKRAMAGAATSAQSSRTHLLRLSMVTSPRREFQRHLHDRILLTADHPPLPQLPEDVPRVHRVFLSSGGYRLGESREDTGKPAHDAHAGDGRRRFHDLPPHQL